MSTLPPHLRARVLDDARRAPAPTVAARRSRALAVVLLGVAASALLSYRLGLHTVRSTGVLFGLGLGGAVSALLATWVAASRGRSMLGRPRVVLLAVAVAAPVALVAWAVTMTGFEGGVVLAGGTAAQHAICAVFTLLLAVGPFAALVYVRRGSDPVHPRALGAALGGAAGAWGGALIDVHCQVTTVEHLAVGHALPIVLLGLVGALAAARSLGVRASDPSRG